MADFADDPDNERPIVIGPITERDTAVIEHLVTALVEDDFDAFSAALPLNRLDRFPPEQREAAIRQECAMFERFAGRVAPTPRSIHVRTGLGGVRLINVTLRMPGQPRGTADLAIARREGTGSGSNDFVQLNPGLAEQPVDPSDRSRIDAVIAALVAGDWPAFQRLTSSPARPDLQLPYFDLFAHKVGALKRIDCRMNQAGQRLLLVLLGAREPGARDLTLSLMADGKGESTTFIGAQLEEEGFDRSAFERERRRIANLKSPPLPPWQAHPEIPRYSIGWRMGYGEATAIHFSEFFSELPDEDKTRFERAHPEPEEWSGYYRRLRGEAKG